METSAGVAAGGEALAQAVRDIRADMQNVTTVSFVGFSLGGLYARYAAGLLLPDGVACADGQAPVGCGLQLGMYASISSPHLGTRGALWALYEHAVAWGVVGQTGQDLAPAVSAAWDSEAAAQAMSSAPVQQAMAAAVAAASADGSVQVEQPASPVMNVSELPLLLRMAHPDLPWWQALHTFRARAAAGALSGDDKVPYWSAALAPCAGTYGPGEQSSYPVPERDNAHTHHLQPAACQQSSIPTASVDASLPSGHVRRAVRSMWDAGYSPADIVTAVLANAWPSPPAPEALAAAYLHAAGSWTIVDAEIGGWGAAWLTHFRMGGLGLPGVQVGAAGDAVPRYMASLPDWTLVAQAV